MVYIPYSVSSSLGRGSWHFSNQDPKAHRAFNVSPSAQRGGWGWGTHPPVQAESPEASPDTQDKGGNEKKKQELTVTNGVDIMLSFKIQTILTAGDRAPSDYNYRLTALDRHVYAKNKKDTQDVAWS